MKSNRIIIFIILISMMISIVACEVNSYTAIGLVRITKDNYCETSFIRLDGQLVFTPRFNNGSEGQIHYVAHLDEGEINVYYEGSVDKKLLLFNIKAGESIDSYGGYIEKGKQRIIIETLSPAKGKISLEFI